MLITEADHCVSTPIDRDTSALTPTHSLVIHTALCLHAVYEAVTQPPEKHLHSVPHHQLELQPHFSCSCVYVARRVCYADMAAAALICLSFMALMFHVWGKNRNCTLIFTKLFYQRRLKPDCLSELSVLIL